MKPTSCNRGWGVHVFDSVDKCWSLMKEISEGTIEKLVNQSKGNESEEDDDPKYEIKASYFVIQKYIEKPLLIWNWKFDIWVWMLINH